MNAGIDEFPREEQVIGYEDGGVGEAGEADGAIRYFQRDELSDDERPEQERGRGEGDGGRIEVAGAGDGKKTTRGKAEEREIEKALDGEGGFKPCHNLILGGFEA